MIWPADNRLPTPYRLFRHLAQTSQKQLPGVRSSPANAASARYIGYKRTIHLGDLVEINRFGTVARLNGDTLPTHGDSDRAREAPLIYGKRRMSMASRRDSSPAGSIAAICATHHARVAACPSFNAMLLPRSVLALIGPVASSRSVWRRHVPLRRARRRSALPASRRRGRPAQHRPDCWTEAPR